MIWIVILLWIALLVMGLWLLGLSIAVRDLERGPPLHDELIRDLDRRCYLLERIEEEEFGPVDLNDVDPDKFRQ